MKPLTVFQKHVRAWSGGCGSEHCGPALRRVLARGSVPCDVLFIGEAPGEAENVIGQPFVGPAGKLLDQIVERASRGVQVDDGSGHDGRRLRFAYTNVVCCIPRNPESGKKWEEPDDDQVESCRPRLEEFINDVARPRLVVAVGQLASVWLTRGYKHSIRLPEGAKLIHIIHPAAILRDNEANRWFKAQRAQVVLSNALEEL